MSLRMVKDISFVLLKLLLESCYHDNNSSYRIGGEIKNRYYKEGGLNVRLKLPNDNMRRFVELYSFDFRGSLPLSSISRLSRLSEQMRSSTLVRFLTHLKKKTTKLKFYGKNVQNVTP